jgi:LDH2 family malate/lactate/ureidoglycolate dehydrogenase
VLYRVPPGAILPLGGERLGHRGFGLGLLVEAMATLLTGDNTADPSRVGNNLTFIVIAVEPEFGQRADGMVDYVQSSAARGDDRVLFPGRIEQDRRLKTDEVVLGETTWEAILERAGRAGVALD